MSQQWGRPAPASYRPEDFARSAEQRYVDNEPSADNSSAMDGGSDGPAQDNRGRSTAPALGPLEFARWIWRQLTSMRTALILLFLLAVAAIPGSLIPQLKVAPSEVFAFKNRHPGLTPAFERLSLFNVYSSVWFSAVYLLLMLSLVGCIIPRLRVYVRGFRARPPKAPRNLSRLTAYDTWISDESLAVEAERVRKILKKQRRRVDIHEGEEEIVVCAEKGYLREAGNLLFHLSLLVVLVGVAVTGCSASKATLPSSAATGSPTR